MKRALLASCVLSMVGVAGVTWGQDSAAPPNPQLYDDFRGPFIDPHKWEAMGGWSARTLEFAREIVAQRLRLGARTYGNSWDGGWEFDVAELNFKDPGSISSMGTRIIVTKVQSAGCPTGDAPGTYTRAQLIGNFFKIGPTTSDEGNLDAMIEIANYDLDNPNGPLTVRFLVLVNGGATVEGATVGLIDLGMVDIGEEVFVFVRWDKANRRFVGGLKRLGVPAVTGVIPYALDDTVGPVWPYKGVSIRNTAPNCSASQAFVGMTAWFDNVFVNVPWEP